MQLLNSLVITAKGSRNISKMSIYFGIVAHFDNSCRHTITIDTVEFTDKGQGFLRV